MATETQTVTGVITRPDGTSLSAGIVRFTLSRVDPDQTNDEVVIPPVVDAVIGNDGSISAALWPNTLGFYGTVYKVHVIRMAEVGQQATLIGRIQVGEAGPYELTDLLVAGDAPAEGVFYSVLTEAEYNAAIAAKDAAEDAAADAALYDGPKVDTFDDLDAVTGAQVGTGDFIRVIEGGAVLKGVASGETITTTGGAKLVAVRGPEFNTRDADTLGEIAKYPDGTIGYAAGVGYVADSSDPDGYVRSYGGARVETIAELTAFDRAKDGDTITVWNGSNGEREDYRYDASSTLTADGALVVDATAMGAGRYVSKRTVYADFDELDGDVRALSVGVLLSVIGVAEYEVVSTGEDFTTTGGLKLKALLDGDGVLHFGAFDPDYTGSVSAAVMLQSAIDTFGTDRGVIKLGDGRLLLDASIDFKRVALEGATKPSDAGGGTLLTFSGTHGLYTSIEDQQCPLHRNLRITGSAEKTANGQTLVSFKGINYPRMSDVYLYGAENGILLENGAVVECHYGAFFGVDISRCYNDVKIVGDVQTQSHSFFGGRSWDNVYCASNDGAQDINFIGRQFEGGLFPNHTSQTASTKTIGCRFEGTTTSESILLGEHTSVGDYTSGFQVRKAITCNAGAITRNTKRSIVGAVGADGVVVAAPTNMLRNSALKLDVNDNTKIPGWTAPAVAHTALAGLTGNMLKATATSAFHSYEQHGLDVPAGEYTMGFFIQRDAADAGFFSIYLQLLDSSGAVIDDSASGDGTNFGASNFTNISGNHRGFGVVRKVRLTTDRTNVRFRAAANSATGKTIYFGKPFMHVGHTDIAPSGGNDTNPATIGYGTAAPSAGTYRVGDLVYNTAPTAGGTIGWVCTTAGSPGTWKTFGTIAV